MFSNRLRKERKKKKTKSIINSTKSSTLLLGIMIIKIFKHLDNTIGSLHILKMTKRGKVMILAEVILSSTSSVPECRSNPCHALPHSQSKKKTHTESKNLSRIIFLVSQNSQNTHTFTGITREQDTSRNRILSI